MIVYRSTQQEIDVSQWLADLHELARAGYVDGERATSLLIDSGLLEAGVADWQNPYADSNDAVTRVFRNANLVLGHLFYHSYHGTREVERWAGKFDAALHDLEALPLPQTVTEGAAEGYAYYSLYPEMYLRATLDFVQAQHPDHVVVIGLRNIGAGLSAVVAATLEEQGIAVRSYTVRPRGHPFYRELKLTPALAGEWRAQTGSWFAIVDEGPGLSGSSFTSAAQAVANLGVPDSRIVLFPSWQGEAARFVSASARDHWHRYQKYTATFEDVILRPGMLTGSATGQAPIDLSGGNWRRTVFSCESDYPAVQPQHETRKYLLDGEPPTLYKFAGLGRYGREKLRRAEALSNGGMGLRPLGLTHGFLATEFVPGRPLSKSCVDQGLLDAIAQYLAYLSRTFPAREGTSFDTLLEMIHYNVAEALGDAWRDRLKTLEQMRTSVTDAPPIALDARMLPHEWLDVRGAYIKTDALDHHDDHFFPGPQNIAWDLAGAFAEFELGASERSYLLAAFRAATREGRDVEARMPFYRVAYLAFRLGYVTLAGQSVEEPQERARYQKLAKSYTRQLKQAIAQACQS